MRHTIIMGALYRLKQREEFLKSLCSFKRKKLLGKNWAQTPLLPLEQQDKQRVCARFFPTLEELGGTRLQQLTQNTPGKVLLLSEVVSESS